MGCVRLGGAQEEPWLLSLFFCVRKSYGEKKKKTKNKTIKPNKPNPTSSSASVGWRPKTVWRGLAAQMEIL